MRRGRPPTNFQSRRTQQRRPSPLVSMSSHSSRDRRGRRSTSIKSRSSPKRDSGRIRGPISIEKKRSPSPRRRQRRSVSSPRRFQNKALKHHDRTEEHRTDFSPNGTNTTTTDRTNQSGSSNNNINRGQSDIRSREAIKHGYRSRSRSPLHVTKSSKRHDLSSISRSPNPPSESQKNVSSETNKKKVHQQRSSSNTRYEDDPLSTERSFVFSASSKTEPLPAYIGTKDIDERQVTQQFKKRGEGGRFDDYDEDDNEQRNRNNDRNKRRNEIDDYGRDPEDISNERPSGSGKIYTQEELKKITIDIFRPVESDESTKKRLSFNPNDVVIVRRATEGQRPIFDRDEIKQALAGRGDNDIQERRVVAIVKERSRSPHCEPEAEYSAVEQRENFQINTENFQSYGDRDQNLGSTRPSLNDRWQKLEPRPSEWNVGPSRSSRTKDVEAVGGYTSDSNNDYVGYDRRSRSRLRSRSRTPQHDPHIRYSYDRYFESIQRSSDTEKLVADNSRNYSDVYSRDTALSQMQHHHNRRPIPSDPHDLRHSLSYKRRESYEMHPPPPSHYHHREGMIEREQPRQDRHRHSHDTIDHDRDRGARRSRSWERIERRAPDTTTGGTRSHGHYQDERNQVYGSRNRFNDYGFGRDAKESSSGPPGGGGRLPNFSSRPDKYRYQEWLEKPDVVPKGPSYFEHDNRGDRHFNRSRGAPARGGFVPHTRGGYVPRPRGLGGFRGATSGGRGFRGHGYQPQRHYNQPISSSSYSSRTQFSPSQWKHDMFERAIQDGNMDQDNNPSSTTGNN